MKNYTSTLAIAALVAAFATITAQAATTRVLTQGRAGYSVAPPVMEYTSARGGRSATIVALAMEKPQQGPTRIQTLGRGGYVAVPNTTNR